MIGWIQKVWSWVIAEHVWTRCPYGPEGATEMAFSSAREIDVAGKRGIEQGKSRLWVAVYVQRVC
jgi:hypothetical protein